MILSIETSTKVCSVGLHDRGHLVADQSYHLSKSHSSLLPGIINELLENSSVAKADLNAVAVSAGPGSYTGLRIGVSSAKGLCFGLRIPLISIPTLEILLEKAISVVNGTCYILPMIDARRMEVYTMITNETGKIIEETHALVLEESTFDHLTGKPVWLVGNGAEKFKSINHRPDIRIEGEWFPDARYMGRIAYRRFRKEEFEDLAYFEPDYLKEFQTKKAKNQLRV